MKRKKLSQPFWLQLFFRFMVPDYDVDDLFASDAVPVFLWD